MLGMPKVGAYHQYHPGVGHYPIAHPKHNPDSEHNPDSLRLQDPTSHLFTNPKSIAYFDPTDPDPHPDSRLL